jgi:hypothetical protein
VSNDVIYGVSATGAGSLARPAAVALFAKLLRAHHEIDSDRAATRTQKLLSQQSLAVAGLLNIVVGVLTGDERNAVGRSRTAL